MVEIVCLFELGRLSELYEFSWDGMSGDNSGPITNGTLGVYWLAEENNRTLHVDISAPRDPRNFQCVGAVQTCSGSSCDIESRNSPTIMVLNTIGKFNISLSLCAGL